MPLKILVQWENLSKPFNTTFVNACHTLLSNHYGKLIYLNLLYIKRQLVANLSLFNVDCEVPLVDEISQWWHVTTKYVLKLQLND